MIASGILKLIMLEAACVLILLFRSLIWKSKLRKEEEDMRRLRDYSLSEMHQIRKNKRLVLVITHDKSILKDADSIIEIWDGEISR